MEYALDITDPTILNAMEKLDIKLNELQLQ